MNIISNNVYKLFVIQKFIFVYINVIVKNSYLHVKITGAFLTFFSSFYSNA